jgi:hypothetical protein
MMRAAITRGRQIRDTHVSLAHGNGGRMMREMIEELFARALANPLLDGRTGPVRHDRRFHREAARVSGRQYRLSRGPRHRQ